MMHLSTTSLGYNTKLLKRLPAGLALINSVHSVALGISNFVCIHTKHCVEDDVDSHDSGVLFGSAAGPSTATEMVASILQGFWRL
jgi:hypothetical protein